MARCKARVLTTGLVVGGGRGMVLTLTEGWCKLFASPRGRKGSLCKAVRLQAPWRRKKFFPVVLSTTGPEEILCPGRVGSRAPIRGPCRCWDPLLGLSGGSLRRMSQRRRFRCGTGKLTLQPARWSAHNSTEVLEVATKLLKPITSLSYALERSHVRTLQPITNPYFQDGLHALPKCALD
jgi:hypothetical protein